ncbi:TPR repeat-containing protein YrrB [Halioglobus japonicus]|nr:TPR repeat-containing protein YrrB [Halioglobus japonicus]
MTESLTFLHQGEALLKQERWEEAVEAFRKSIDLDAENPWPYHHLGDALARLGHLSEAIATYEQALALAPRSPWTLKNFGNALSRLGRWEQAEAAYRRAIGFDWAEPMTFLHLGETLANQGHWKEAAHAYRTSICLDADNFWPHHHLGDALCHLDDYAAAVASYEQALARSPESLWTLRNLGRALREMGRWEQAEAIYQKALALDSTEPQIFLQLGETLGKQGRWEAAAEAYRNSIRLDAENAWSHHHLGDALGRLEDLSAAVTAYEKALALSPDSPATLQNLGNAQANLNCWEEAADAYQRSLSINGDDAETCINLGNALSKLQRWHEAEAAYLQARLVLPDDLRLAQALAGVWLKLERWQEAATAYEQCVAASPDDAQLQRNLGIAVFKLETQKAYLKANPNALLHSHADEALPLPELEWTEARFGPRVFEVERWLEKLIPGQTTSSVNSDDGGDKAAQHARMLFILDNDFGELTTVMYMLMGHERLDHFMVQLPERLYQANSEAFPGRTFCYQSMGDLEQAVESFAPDIVFLCSGYLYCMHDICSHQALETFVDSLIERNCKVVTADPFLGVLSQQPISSLISIDVPDATELDLPAHVFTHLESVKKEQDEQIVEQLAGAERILRHHVHLYPAHAHPSATQASETDAREVSFFNPHLLYKASLEPDVSTKPHWLFILSATDLEGQLMFEAVHGFREIVVRLLKQAVEAGRRPIFVAPEKFIRELARDLRGYEGVELLSFCAFTRLVSLLLTAEYAFYWNSVSHTILLRSFNGLPVILFDRGHLVRNVESIYDRVVQWYYQGSQPIYMDHHQPLTLAGLDAATVDYKQNSEQMVQDFQRAPDPGSLVREILDATGTATATATGTAA